MKVTPEPRLPGFVPQLVIRLTDLFREFATALNAVTSRTDTPIGVTAVTVGASPFSYVAPADGVLSIVGGTVSALAYIRQSTTVTLPLTGLVPVKKGDTVRITYSVAPTVNLL